MRAMLIAAFSLMLCGTAFAQNSAKIDWYGVYTSKDSQEIKDPTSPTGKRYVTTPIPPASNSLDIPADDTTRFGFSYTVNGRSGGQVTVKHVYRFPPPGMPDAATGAFRTTYERTRENNIGESVLIGWSFDGAPPERIVFGEWSMEVWQGNRIIAQRKFNVYKP
jgi:hypothetical protein